MNTITNLYLRLTAALVLLLTVPCILTSGVASFLSRLKEKKLVIQSKLYLIVDGQERSLTNTINLGDISQHLNPWE